MKQLNEVNSLNKVIMAIRIYTTVEDRCMADILYIDGRLEEVCWSSYDERCNILNNITSATLFYDTRNSKSFWSLKDIISKIQQKEAKGENNYD